MKSYFWSLKANHFPISLALLRQFVGEEPLSVLWVAWWWRKWRLRWSWWGRCGRLMTVLSCLTRFRRKRHSRYIGLRELITNAVGLKKNSKRHIFKFQDLPFPIANSQLHQHIINYEKMLFKQKKAWFFRSLFFLNWVFKSFPVSNQPATFSIGGINVWT